MTLDPADLFRTFHDASPDAVLALDEEHRVVSMNSAAERLFAAKPDRLVGRRLQVLFADPRDFERISRLHLSGHSAADQKPFIGRYRSQASQVFDGETRTAPLVNPDGVTTGHLCIIRNISDRLALQARLEASDIKLATATVVVLMLAVPRVREQRAEQNRRRSRA